MTESPLATSLAAWEFAHVTDRLEDCLTSIKESLKGFKSLIEWKPSERLNEKMVVYEALSGSEAWPISKLVLPEKNFEKSFVCDVKFISFYDASLALYMWCNYKLLPWQNPNRFGSEWMDCSAVSQISSCLIMQRICLPWKGCQSLLLNIQHKLTIQTE